MNRHDWYLENSKEIINRLPQEGRKLIGAFDTLPNQPHVAEAALLAFICARYAQVDSPDEIARHILRWTGKIEQVAKRESRS